MLAITAVSTRPRSSKFDMPELIEEVTGSSLAEGDVLVISSKFVAISEGRVVDLSTVKPGREAMSLATKHRVDARLCELVLRESDTIIGGIPGFLLATRDGVLTPNAGIDKSNVERGAVVMYPRHPEASARMIRESIRFSKGIHVGVVICDSRLSPTRKGTTGVAVAASGVEGILDMRGRVDLFGNVLKVTSQGIADDLSSAAEVLMGESDEAVPMVLVRGLQMDLLRESEYGGRRFSIGVDECVYMRSVGYAQRA